MDKIIKEFSEYKLFVTTYGISYAIKNGIDIDKALDSGVKVRAYSHILHPLENLSMEETEAILLAKDFDSILIVGDEKIKEIAEKNGVKTVMI
ncbi:hypothetical protein DFR86_10215 [Acidianus sulfidivorans JP7]|uniref:HAD family hydrolase n=1 Tax=Acidianus sulfidivorans JP7 TaxID=619593 RepID=A0A2U9IQL1_9CREN|nr:hypothetical protein DFR86_10215 [Acidianus sulfidivorans JP7]